MAARRAVAVAAAGILLTLVALIFDAAPLFVPAVACVVLGVLAPLWVWAAIRGARTHRVVAADRVIENQPLEAMIEVHRGPLGLPGAEVVDPFTNSRIELAGPLSPVRGARTATVRVVGRFSRRGLRTLAPPYLIARDPLDLARMQSQITAAAQAVLVLPRTEPVRWLTPDRGRRFELSDGHAASDAMAAVDLDGLRPYRPGTPASRIHWPAVARGAGLIERRLRVDGDTRPLVVLDARVADGTGAIELLDAAVRAAASLVLEFARGGGCGLLLPGDHRATAIDRELTTWPAVHARLAVVSGGPTTRAPLLGRATGRLGPMIYVAAETSARLGAVLGGASAGQTVLVVPQAGLSSGRPAGIRRGALATLDVSGCRGFVLGARRERDQHRSQPTVA